MGEHGTKDQKVSRVMWEHLEGWIRERVQELVQAILEEEVTELLGRLKSQRRGVVDGGSG